MSETSQLPLTFSSDEGTLFIQVLPDLDELVLQEEDRAFACSIFTEDSSRSDIFITNLGKHLVWAVCRLILCLVLREPTKLNFWHGQVVVDDLITRQMLDLLVV